MGVRTYEWGLVGHGGQDFIQDEQQHRNGQQHSDFEAQLLSTMVCDEEGGEVQSQEEQDGQQEVDDMEEGSPLDGELGKQVQRSGWIGKGVWADDLWQRSRVCSVLSNVRGFNVMPDRCLHGGRAKGGTKGSLKGAPRASGVAARLAEWQ